MQAALLAFPPGMCYSMTCAAIFCPNYKESEDSPGAASAKIIQDGNMNEINESLYEIIQRANVPRTINELADLSGMDYAELQRDLDALTAC